VYYPVILDIFQLVFHCWTQNTKLLNTLTPMSRWQCHWVVWWLCTNLSVEVSTVLSWKRKLLVPPKRWHGIA